MVVFHSNRRALIGTKLKMYMRHFTQSRTPRLISFADRRAMEMVTNAAIDSGPMQTMNCRYVGII